MQLLHEFLTQPDLCKFGVFQQELDFSALGINLLLDDEIFIDGLQVLLKVRVDVLPDKLELFLHVLHF